jgi:hypothetical protein
MTEKWRPNYHDVPQPIPVDNLIKKAIDKLIKLGIVTFPWERLKDEHGIYGYRYGHFILVAKKEIYGNIVSFHETAILTARMHHVYIVMWLQEANKFYQFDPELCDKKGIRNQKGASTMVNVPISFAKDTGWKA